MISEREFFAEYRIIPAGEDKSRQDIWGIPRPRLFDFAVYRKGYRYPVYVRYDKFQGWKYRGEKGGWKKLSKLNVVNLIKILEKWELQ